MSIDQLLALVFVAVALLQARCALKTSPMAPSTRQSELFLSALSSALCAVFLLMPGFSVGAWLALLAMAGTCVAGVRLFIGRQRQSKVSRGQS